MKKIFFIYPSTPGSNGLYLDSIYKVLKDKYDIKLFVNHYYPFDYSEAEKIFFKYTEKCDENKHKVKGVTRKIIRLIELIIGLVKTYFCVLKEKPEIINYSVLNLPFTEYFIRMVKLASKRTKLVITCHDVIPFNSTKHINYKLIYDMADYLLVHNEFGENKLIELYGIDKKKIIKHPFPSMDLTNMVSIEKRKSHAIKKFLFIGFIRAEKGVDILLDAWNKIDKSNECQLTIAGFLTDEVKIDIDKFRNDKSVNMILRNLSDYEYASLVNKCDCVVLPYKQVGNSGVLSTIAAMSKVIIASDLPVFRESEYINNKLLFEVNNSVDLANKINQCAKLKDSEIKDIVESVSAKYMNNQEDFYNKVIRSYRKVEG